MPGLRQTGARGLVLMGGKPAPHPGKGHRARLRDKFLRYGLDKFIDEEVLELLLTLATPRKDCKQQARGLLARFGSLSAVLEAAPEALAQEKGIGPRNILGLKLVPAAARRYLADSVSMGEPISASEVADYLRIDLQARKREVFKVILLDGGRRILAMDDIFMGSNREAPVYPRQVAALALALGADALICAHNHPQGGPRPSRDDIDMTRRLYHSLRGVGVDLEDHLVVGGGEVYSFTSDGRIAAWAAEYEKLDL